MSLILSVFPKLQAVDQTVVVPAGTWGGSIGHHGQPFRQKSGLKGHFVGFDPSGTRKTREIREMLCTLWATSPMVGAGSRNRPGPAVARSLCINTGDWTIAETDEPLCARHLISGGDVVNIWQLCLDLLRSPQGWRSSLAAPPPGRGGCSGEADKGKHK